MKKVGILYICTGKYSVFWKNFFKTTEKYFLPDVEKHYFIFTDSKKILKKSNERIHPIFQEVEAWPFPTLHRFDYFLKASGIGLEEMDYLLFMNANLLVQKTILSNEILPQVDEKLFVTLHPGFFNKTPSEFTYDRNPNCNAYIPIGEGKHYFAGGFNGGLTQDFIKMSKTLSEKIKEDIEKNIIAIWHDESQLNRYMLDYTDTFRILSPSYLYPQGWELPFEKKIMILDKNKYGGHKFLRNLSKKFPTRILISIFRR